VRRRTGGAQFANAAIFLSQAALPARVRDDESDADRPGLLRMGESQKEWIHVAMSGDDGVRATAPALPEGEVVGDGREGFVDSARSASRTDGSIPGDLPDVVFA
jgi:hypothetical protein